ncbi:unnamed protein product [Rotaria sordida]|uniref:Uncharacterized protein n=1 Tax=Rotaria sordida TaxID=392033 RepID=A0A814Z4W0_9BILA|nr:unnamed protein product [Rotaria sordida]CAF0973971.1 unnamed protein product [Rotaria sordida]CAF1238893.1 unnamed protein product [Rotaria sordida]CAF1251519.1 unnamed protein product [Rotaria sordida]CAF1555491.1 unnamed protein product [Rotaria sordida]
MGAEYSQPPRLSGLSNFLNEAYSRGGTGKSRVRCWKCSGHGRLYIDYECTICRCHDQTSWSNYTKHCSCNGYGRQTHTELCDDCHGRGHR